MLRKYWGILKYSVVLCIIREYLSNTEVFCDIMYDKEISWDIHIL